MLIPRGNSELSKSLKTLFGGNYITQFIFGIGVLAMAFSSISVLMLISGFVACEVTGQDRKGPAFKIGTLLTATGLLWPMLWTGGSKAYCAVIVSTFGYVLFPIAFLAFIFLMNSKKVLKEEMPTGRSRWIWNSLMGVSIIITGLAAGWTALQKKIDGFHYGKWFLIIFVISILIGQIYQSRKNSLK